MRKDFIQRGKDKTFGRVYRAHVKSDSAVELDVYWVFAAALLTRVLFWKGNWRVNRGSIQIFQFPYIC